MTRLGWGMLLLFLAAAGTFASVLSVGGASAPAPRLTVMRSVPARQRLLDGGLLAVPVAGVARGRIMNSWGDGRDGGARRHHGTDIPAPAGTAVSAVAQGTVEKLYRDARGGITLYERSADRRWVYYYAHLAGYTRGLREGQAVRPGDPLGYVGDTGDAGPGNYHLHFGLTRIVPGQHWWEGEDVNPYPWLTGRRGRERPEVVCRPLEL